MGSSGKTRVVVLIWLAIATAIVVAVYRIALASPAHSPLMDRVFGLLPAEDWVTNVLIFWSLTLLLASSFMWRAAFVHQRELADIISSVSPDVLAVVSPDRVITLCNPAVKDMFGYEVSEVVGKKTDLLYFDRRVEKNRREVYESLKSCGFHVGFGVGRKKSGETFPLEIITGDRQGQHGAVLVIRDITVRKRDEEQVLKAKESAEVANTEKSRALEELAASYERLKGLETQRDNLTHMVVHDIRHAVSGIAASLDLAQRGIRRGDASAAAEPLDHASGFTEDVLRMVQSLLDISRMEAGQIELDRTTCAVDALVDEALKPLQSLADGKGLTIVRSGLDAALYGDRGLLVRVIRNLAANAVKYAPAGTNVVVRGGVDPEGTVVSISDRGPGVPPRFRTVIFEKFGRVEMKRSGTDYSTGLGLAFCKLAVETHGGRIGVESPSDVAGPGGGPGSTFWFRLPAAVASGTNAGRATGPGA